MKDIIIMLLSKSPTAVCIETIFQCLFSASTNNKKKNQEFTINPELRLDIVSSCSKSQKKDLLKEDICKTILVSDIHTKNKNEGSGISQNKNTKKDISKTVLVSDIHTESKIDSLIDIMKADAMTSIRGDVFVALLEQMVTAVSLGVTQRSSTTNYNAGKI